jgi:hypothetical protein
MAQHFSSSSSSNNLTMMKTKIGRKKAGSTLFHLA